MVFWLVVEHPNLEIYQHMDDNGGYHYDSGNHHIDISSPRYDLMGENHIGISCCFLVDVLMTCPRPDRSDMSVMFKVLKIHCHYITLYYTHCSEGFPWVMMPNMSNFKGRLMTPTLIISYHHISDQRGLSFLPLPLAMPCS